MLDCCIQPNEVISAGRAKPCIFVWLSASVFARVTTSLNAGMYHYVTASRSDSLSGSLPNAINSLFVCVKARTGRHFPLGPTYTNVVPMLRIEDKAGTMYLLRRRHCKRAHRLSILLFFPLALFM